MTASRLRAGFCHREYRDCDIAGFASLHFSRSKCSDLLGTQLQSPEPSKQVLLLLTALEQRGGGGVNCLFDISEMRARSRCGLSPTVRKWVGVILDFCKCRNQSRLQKKKKEKKKSADSSFRRSSFQQNTKFCAGLSLRSCRLSTASAAN